MKKKKSTILTLFYMVFIVYSIYYAFYMLGYAEVKVRNETILTKEAMEQFEQDLSEGKDVTLENYLQVNKKDYSTKISKLGNKAASFFEYIMDEGIENFVLIIRKLFS